MKNKIKSHPDRECVGEEENRESDRYKHPNDLHLENAHSGAREHPDDEGNSQDGRQTQIDNI